LNRAATAGGGARRLHLPHGQAQLGFRSMKRVALLLLPLCAAAAGGANAEVHETLDTSHYEAKVHYGGSLALALNEASPFRPGNQVFHSATSWYLDWQVRPAPTVDGHCRIREVRIQLHGQMVLPRLLGGSGAQRELFESYLTRLREHELGHYEIGREAARELEREFYALPAASSCAALQTAARAAGARLLPRYEAMGDAYDAQTEHGRTQGAWLVE
jgi:predicted secreted Zn-dependent protease